MKKQLVALVAAASVALVGLTGCSSNDKVIVEKQKEDTAFPALTDKQIKDVFSSLNDVMVKGDSQLSSKVLAERVENPALEMRSTQYTIASKEKKKVEPLPLKAGTITVTASKDWPRVVVNMTSDGPDKPTFVHAIRQNDARSQFKLWQWVRLFPKESVPKTAVTSKGAPVVDMNAKGFKASPKKAVDDYGANVLNADKLKAVGFNDDPLAQIIRSNDKAYRSAVGDRYSFGHSVTPAKDMMALKLEDGGALVFAHYTDTIAMKRSNSRAQLKLKGDVATLMGDGGQADAGATLVFDATVLMVIPEQKSKEPLKVIGAEHVLVSAKKAS